MPDATTRAEELRLFVIEQLGDGYAEISSDTPILDMGILDSLMVQNLLAFIENRHGIQVPPERVRPETFRSIAAIADLIDGCSVAEYSTASSDPFEITNRLMESYGLERSWIDLPRGPRHLLGCAGADPALVLLSGLGSPASSWGTLMRSLAGRRAALALDLGGFGVSDPPADGDPSIGGHVLDTIAVLERRLSGPAVLVGNSAGALIAAEIARRRPDLCRALVVISFGRVGDGRRWWNTLRQLSSDPDAFWQRAFYSPPPLSDGLRDQLESTLDSSAYLDFLDPPTIAGLDRAFADLDLPTLFIGGLEDGIVDPQVVRAGAEQVAGSRLEWIAHCGHYAQSERPEEVLVFISHFLEQIDA